MADPKILVTGALGQIGIELVMFLRKHYGASNVIASFIRFKDYPEVLEGGPYEQIDVNDGAKVAEAVEKYQIDTIYHMAAVLSARGEQDPQLCWDVNMNGLLAVLEASRAKNVKRVIVPSSIAVFGPDAKKQNTPQDQVLHPTSMYGVTKVAGERLCDYYVHRYGLDVRGLRYPGIISNVAPPGGGTTDYSVDIFYKAILNGHFDCFVRADTVLPMMYMPDCLRGTLELAEAPFEKLQHHANYNHAAISFSAEELANEIKKYIPGFTVNYEPDFHQAIADSWPQSIDDSCARAEWGWKHEYDLASMTKDMIEVLTPKLKK